MTVTITKPSVYIETYGCQMNVYDSELVTAILSSHEFSIVSDSRHADIALLNTCSVRENANRKVLNRIHELKRHAGNDLVIGILGCMATNFKTDLLNNKQLQIDLIAGPDSYKHLPSLIHESFATKQSKKPYDVTLSEFETYADIQPIRQDGVNAWIAIMRGCNNFCTFCVVPFTRGRERSRSAESIIDECKRLVDDGFTQVTLLGQNVNSYQCNQTTFTDLMDQVSRVNGLKRIRFTSPHPKDFPVPLLQLMAERDNICNHVHMPLQAGSNRILQKMNRTYTQEEFLALIDTTRRMIPNVEITTDVIVGFPTETDAEFEETMHTMREAQFHTAFMFKYSQRTGTTASRRFKDDVSEKIKSERMIQLVHQQKDISLGIHQKKIGTVQPVLIEKIGTKKDTSMFFSRDEHNTIVTFPVSDDVSVGDYVPITITHASPHRLMGHRYQHHLHQSPLCAG